jgi:phosphotransferase system  glucose/maltose/N-acetylglucosamine-specific IIC component
MRCFHSGAPADAVIQGMYTISICFLLIYTLQKHKNENVPEEDEVENTEDERKAKKRRKSKVCGCCYPCL